MREARVIRPGQTIGILGGGQLGRMMAIAARQMGYGVVTLDPTPDSPCGQVADHQVVAALDDAKAARELARRSDVVTYEFENVDAAVAKALEQDAHLPQGSRLLHITQHRLREKAAVRAAGVAVAPFQPAWDAASLRAAVEALGLPCVVKTTRGGYDGKGQWVIRGEEDLAAVVESAFSARSESAARAGGDPAPGATLASARVEPDEVDEAPLIVEGFVPFAAELSVLVARRQDGRMVSFPPAENIHRDGILHLSIVPARLPEAVLAAAVEAAERVARALDAVGVLAVEMFVTREGRVLVNELAPRPHNSGHYTLDACDTSQFEQHVRAICHLELARPKLTSPVVMVNVLGQHLDGVLREMAAWPGHVKVHLYGKREAKPGRKMGHVNVLAEDVEAALAQIRRLGVWDRV
ncbi:5-(carboxyamino)imidazole ribonucleotide synthase [Alicyclobacillus sp.]|uniref:5-(carboxyamino)imidazole ribonucleotide synthase n=1 Tax=Alicyclobacillus sp. TaxID=61169 RepID=UPI0025C2B1A3|nr:5-(carboxyamino)imidazole ribonucleotide synthase [Alicyclobacillus sp.]MCL6517425.1 5-(carboxyamino)imidazole ribonucleotide synthase [Alicyclobacillus sp.]